jgi:hypothetical protein
MLELAPIVYLITFFALIYFSKEIVDCRRMMASYPCLRSQELRMWLTVLSASPLILAVNPPWFWVAYFSTYIGLSGAVLTLSRTAKPIVRR